VRMSRPFPTRSAPTPGDGMWLLRHDRVTVARTCIVALAVVVASIVALHTWVLGRHITECGINQAGRPYANVRIIKPFGGMGYTDKDHAIVEFHYPGSPVGGGDSEVILPKTFGVVRTTVVASGMGRIRGGDPSKLTCTMQDWTT
jgi:hypothetical protein